MHVPARHHYLSCVALKLVANAYAFEVKSFTEIPILSLASRLPAAEQVAVANDMSCCTHDYEGRHQLVGTHFQNVYDLNYMQSNTKNMADTTQLKRLAFVQGYASQGYSTCESVYKTARGFVPSFVEPYAKQAEETAVSVAAPYLTKAQDAADKLLAGVDSQVRDHSRFKRRKACSALLYAVAVA